MKTSRVLGGVTALALLCLSCGRPAQQGGSEPAPPASDKGTISVPPPQAKTKSWPERVNEVPLRFLAVYREASRIHTERGTTATYSIGFLSDGAERKVVESALECPPPAEALPLIDARLQHYKPGPEPDWELVRSPLSFKGVENVVLGEGGKDCTTEESLRVWREATDRIQWRK